MQSVAVLRRLRAAAIDCSNPASHRALHTTQPALAGHSKWSKIARDKGVNDAQRSVLLSKHSAVIAAAARAGGADPAMNMRLATAIDKAKLASVPKDVIERAVNKSDAAAVESVLYEGVGPASLAVLVACVTDNRKRTTAAVRAIFNKHGGELQSTGSVSYLFDSKGMLTFACTSPAEEETVLDTALTAGAADIEVPEGEGIAVVYTAAGELQGVRKRMLDVGLAPLHTELLRVATTLVDVPPDKEETVSRFLEWLDENPDVEAVFHNAAE